MKSLYSFILLVIVLGIGYYLTHLPLSPTTSIAYASSVHGIRFSYPHRYFLEERNVGEGARSYYAIILTENTEEHRAVREGEAPGREGPVAITIDIHSNVEGLSPEAWVRANPQFSNFNLIKGDMQTTRMGALSSVSYSWDGLYTADSVVISLRNTIYLFSVTYLAPEDQIRKDFSALLQTVRFE